MEVVVTDFVTNKMKIDLNICFIQEWKTGLAHKYVVPTLSQYIVGCCGKEIVSSMSKEQIHESLVAVKAIAWYSTSMDE